MHIINFNPRSHERSDDVLHVRTNRDLYFNPRSHERSDGKEIFIESFEKYFNPRSHERSDQNFSKTCRELAKFQSTLPREERHKESNFNSYNFISIHAPTRGATTLWLLQYCSGAISIHAPTRGATAILHKKFVYFYTIPTINI